MKQSKQEAQIYQEDEIDLRALALSLIERKFIIIGLTAFITALAVVYTNTFTLAYQANISFLTPSSKSLTNLNKLIYTEETKNSVLASFLTIVSSQEFQKEVFIEDDFLTKFNKDNRPIDDVNGFIEDAINSITIERPKKIEEEVFYLNKKPYSISMKGHDDEVISNYLNILVKRADSKNIEEIHKLNQNKISFRLDQIAIDSEMLFKKYRENRLNQIYRIKEEDSQKLREINDQIARVRYKAKENRLNQIEVLTDAAKLAGFLGIIENNLEQIDKVDKNNFNFNIAINDDADLPEWYLYGEKALIQRVELLESRKSDDPFIPELVTLNNQLNEIQLNNTLKTLEARQNDDPFIPEIVSLQKTLKEVQLNNTLKTLEARQDDSPFIAEIVNLTIEKNKLESSVINISGANAIQIRQVVTSKALKSNKRMIVLLAFIGSFVLSLFLALIMDALKPDEKTPA